MKARLSVVVAAVTCVKVLNDDDRFRFAGDVASTFEVTQDVGGLVARRDDLTASTVTECAHVPVIVVYFVV